MENTPTPYQRNRRAGRIAPLIEEPALPQQPALQELQPAAQQPAPATQPQGYAAQPSPYAPPQQAAAAPTQPARAPASYPQAVPGGQPFAMPTQQPGAAPVQAQPLPPPRQGYPARPAQPAANRPPRALQQQRQMATWQPPAPQPIARREGPVVTQAATRHVSPAGERPRAAMNGRPMASQPRQAASQARQDRQTPDAQSNRRHQPVAAANPESPQRQEQPVKPAAKRKVPSWLTTLLSLLLIAVVGLVALDFLVQAKLKTIADEKQAAHEQLLNEYHLTESADGTMRVTYQALIEDYAEQYNLDPAFVTAIIRRESSFRTNAVSNKDARGLMQMMPTTAKDVARMLGEGYDFDKLYDAETSIRYGCCYLAYLSDMFGGDPVLVTAAYNAGLGNVRNWLADRSISPDGTTLPIDKIPFSDTKYYAGKVTESYAIYQSLLYPEEPAQAVLPADGADAPAGAAAVQ